MDDCTDIVFINFVLYINFGIDLAESVEKSHKQISTIINNQSNDREIKSIFHDVGTIFDGFYQETNLTWSKKEFVEWCNRKERSGMA
jgi:hypothetical protein